MVTYDPAKHEPRERTPEEKKQDLARHTRLAYTFVGSLIFLAIFEPTAQEYVPDRLHDLLQVALIGFCFGFSAIASGLHHRWNKP